MCLFPDTGTGKLTVGKVYGGILIHDNWKKTKFGNIHDLRRQEEELEAMEAAEAEEDRKRRRQEAMDRGEDMEEWDRMEEVRACVVSVLERAAFSQSNLLFYNMTVWSLGYL